MPQPSAKDALHAAQCDNNAVDLVVHQGHVVEVALVEVAPPVSIQRSALGLDELSNPTIDLQRLTSLASPVHKDGSSLQTAARTCRAWEFWQLCFGVATSSLFLGESFQLLLLHPIMQGLEHDMDVETRQHRAKPDHVVVLHLPAQPDLVDDDRRFHQASDLELHPDPC